MISEAGTRTPSQFQESGNSSYVDRSKDGSEDNPLRRTSFLHNDYHNKRVSMADGFTERRVGSDRASMKWADSDSYAADREATDVMPFVERPVTVMYPYERLEDLEPGFSFPGRTMVELALYGKPALHAKHVYGPARMTAYT